MRKLTNVKDLFLAGQSNNFERLIKIKRACLTAETMIKTIRGVKFPVSIRVQGVAEGAQREVRWVRRKGNGALTPVENKWWISNPHTKRERKHGSL